MYSNFCHVLSAMSVNILLAINGNNVLVAFKRLGIIVGHARKCLKQEKIKILVHLHGDKDMLKLSYFLLNFFVNGNGTRMIYQHSILPLTESNATRWMEKRQIQIFFLLKIHKNFLQFHEILKGQHWRVSLQKGHLKVANKRKSTYKIFVSAWFLMWTSQGLNLGPPDYESVALTNWATSPLPPLFG